MKTINGVDVLTTIDELVNPRQSAVIVIDMQNSTVSRQGSYARLGRDVSPVTAIVSAVRHLIDAARRAGILITYAVQKGYYPVIVTDCVATYVNGDVALEWLAARFPAFKSAEILAAWNH